MSEHSGQIDAVTREMRAGAEESEAAAAQLEAEGQRITQALAKADALCAYILDHAQAETLSTHIAISFDENDAAMIANMAEAYRAMRVGETSAREQTA